MKRVEQVLWMWYQLWLCYTLGIQELLNSPNPNSPANVAAKRLMTRLPAQYRKKIRAQAMKFADVEQSTASGS